MARVAKETVPLEDGWLQAGTVAAEQYNSMLRYCAAKTGKTLAEKDFAKPKDYVPRIKPAKKFRLNQSSIDITHSIIASYHNK